MSVCHFGEWDVEGCRIRYRVNNVYGIINTATKTVTTFPVNQMNVREHLM